MNKETQEQAIERLCKRHAARTLDKLALQRDRLTEHQQRIIMSGFSFLMEDLNSLSEHKETSNGKIIKQ